MSSPGLRCGIAWLLLACALTNTAEAQSVYLSPRNYSFGQLDVFRPKFDATSSSITSAAYVASYQFPIGSSGRNFLTASLPISVTSLDGSESETALGNPYVGVTLFSRNDPVIYELGARIPIASDNNGGLAGFYGDYDRFEAYEANRFSFKASLIYFPAQSGDWIMYTRVSPLLVIRTGDVGPDARGEFFGDYSVQFFYYGATVQGGFGLTGRAAITEEGSFGERTVHHTGITLQKDFGPIIPSVHFRIPLDTDRRDIVNYVLGLTVVIPV